jgi:hypothetical protein
MSERLRNRGNIQRRGGGKGEKKREREREKENGKKSRLDRE